jgi:hypothetical protein
MSSILKGTAKKAPHPVDKHVAALEGHRATHPAAAGRSIHSGP